MSISRQWMIAFSPSSSSTSASASSTKFCTKSSSSSASRFIIWWRIQAHSDDSIINFAAIQFFLCLSCFNTARIIYLRRSGRFPALCIKFNKCLSHSAEFFKYFLLCYTNRLTNTVHCILCTYFNIIRRYMIFEIGYYHFSYGTVWWWLCIIQIQSILHLETNINQLNSM